MKTQFFAASSQRLNGCGLGSPRYPKLALDDLRAENNPMRLFISRRWSELLTVAAICGWMGLVGCSREAGPAELNDLVPVSGSIKFKGEPTPGAIVTLYPNDTGGTPKLPIA